MKNLNRVDITALKEFSVKRTKLVNTGINQADFSYRNVNCKDGTVARKLCT